MKMINARLRLFEPWRGIAYDLPHIAGAVIGASVIGAGSQIFGAKSAADAQTAAADKNNQRLTDQYNQTRADLAPYRDTGTFANNKLTDLLSNPQDALEKTPGYQFTKIQGLKAVQNGAAARGLGASGAALKGAADFTTGLADRTYQGAYDRLMGVLNTGENAAAQTGVQGNSLVGAQVANTTGGANAQAASYNALGQAGANAANGIGSGVIYNGLYGGNSTPLPQYDPYGTGTVY